MSILELHSKFKTCSGVTTDTRNIKENSMFFALKGEKFNANQFAKDALEKGAKYAIIDEAEFALDDRFILVDDVLTTLQNLAQFHRKILDIPLIGLTGSNGKTTNKELLAAVLAKKYKVYATKGNLNNHIGVPLTLLAIDESYEIAVVEMGANHQKEIELLASICQPTYGFITNIGKAHLEGFGGVEGVRKGKGELFDFLSATQGTVFINETIAVLMEMAAERTFKEVVLYGNDANSLIMLQESPMIEFQAKDIEPIKTHLSGKYNFDNMQTAFAIGCYFGVSAQEAAEAIAAYNPDNNRSQLMQKGSNMLILDAYNANPSSMQASIQNFINLKTDKKKVIIAGDMFELGDAALAEHAELGKLIANGAFDVVVLYGNLMQYALPALPQAYYFTDKFSLHNWLIEKQIRNAYILIKGSRGVGLESVVPFIEHEINN